MKSRSRYGLIAAGIVAFIVLAPFLVLFISGIKYDFSTRQFVKTGLLSANSDPKGAKIYLNGKLAGKTNATIRFLEPGDYQLALKKDGYFTWNKQIDIRGQYATKSAAQPRGVTLFYSQPIKNKLAKNVIAAYSGGKKLIYLLPDRAILTEIGNTNQDHFIALPVVLQNAEITASENENYYLLRSGSFIAVLDAGSSKIYQLGALLAQELKNPTQFGLANDGTLYELNSKGSFFRVNWQNTSLANAPSKNLLLKNISAFYASPDSYSIYVISKNDKQQNSLLLLQLPSLAQTVLAENIPSFKSGKLLVSSNNQIFLLADQSLYSVAQPIGLISDNLSYARMENANQDLLYGNDNEVNVYDLLNAQPSFITRSSAAISNAVGALDLGWVFYTSNGSLQTIETDNRGRQNNFLLGAAGAQAKIFLSADEKNILLLDNGILTQLQIR